ncbi:hypothetical protein HMPREF9391_0863 [Streptococcus sanguinis SK408]|uniref:Uncharacterized protein n=1 Tax=Streptococcus sanguinis SK408 TaxID=888818 RepID=F2CDJ7_STRSA|nr:hypothetical protein HMPREF9392_1133 [Streptococcus sanguinis SK678]EGF19375.1 hypothetical protein HMPREF9391_0863 [Streptococcus sanguinis SK408]EGF20976.1 hypothetical protein HMPREF9395_1349 [Streptococcus sanguinis SK1058]
MNGCFLRWLKFAKLDFTVNEYFKIKENSCFIKKVCYNKIRKSFFI